MPGGVRRAVISRIGLRTALSTFPFMSDMFNARLREEGTDVGESEVGESEELF